MPHYSERNTLLIDDSWYKVEVNRPGTYVVVPKERQHNWLVDDLGCWLTKWYNATNRLDFAACRVDTVTLDDTDKYVTRKMKEGGSTMTHKAWQRHLLHKKK